MSGKGRASDPFIIAGGGIGGLAAALGLARKGYRALVLEQAPELGEIGACMALEDAVSLADKLERHDGDLDAAFAAYRLERVERVVRTARVQMSSRLMGDYVYHPDGAQRLVRNAVLGAKTPEDHYDGLQWLYGGTGLGG